MTADLGAVGVSLGFVADENDTLDEAANEVIGLLGGSLDGLTSNADLLKIRAIARWQAWLAAYGVATDESDTEAGSVKLKSSQTFTQIEKRLAQAEASALRYDEVAAVLAGGSTAYVTTISSIGSPYTYAVGDEFA